MYDQLAAHEIPWTDQSVKDALTEMAKVVGDTDNIAGGTQGALQTDFPTSVTQVFSDPPEGRAGHRGRLRRRRDHRRDGRRAATRASTSSRSRPSTTRRPPSWAAATSSSCSTDTPAAQALVEYLATPEAAQIWAERGGFSSPNKKLDPSVYPDAIHADDGRCARGGRDVPLRPLRPAAGRVRRHGRPGPVQALPGLPREPGRRRRHRPADGAGRRAGVRQVAGTP